MLSRSWVRSINGLGHGMQARRLQIQGTGVGGPLPSFSSQQPYRSIHLLSSSSALRRHLQGTRKGSSMLRWTQAELYGTGIRLGMLTTSPSPSLDIGVPWTATRSFVSYTVPTLDKQQDQTSAGAEGQEKAKEGSATEEEGRGEGKEQNENKKQEDAHHEEQEHIPLIGKVGMGIRAIFRISLFGAIFALVCYCGYYVLRMIVPSSSSPLSVRNDAAKVLEANPEVSSQFGDIARVRGVDLGGRGEGRRNYVPSYTYEVDGRKFTRIKFEVENERKQHAVVYAEVAHDRSRSSDFNYLMLQTGTGKVITVEDNRKPEKPKDLRKYDVSIKLQDDFARFYHGGPDHTASRQQEQILSPHFDYVKQIRCDREEGRCEADGVEPGTLVYRNKHLKAPKSLEELEKETGLSRYTRPGGVSYQDSVE